MEQKVYNLLILDESGSMEVIKRKAVSGLNETLQTIKSASKEHLEQKHYVSLITFNSERIWKAMDRMPVDSMTDLGWNDYSPRNATPLFDAMGQSLMELKEHVDEQDVVLVTIITDGLENASKEYNGAVIKRLVAELRKKGWVFAYIGTNQDVDAVADNLGIRSRMHYDYSSRGTSEMFEKELKSRRFFYHELACENRNIFNEDADYFRLGDEEVKNQQVDDKKKDVPSKPSSNTQKEAPTPEKGLGFWGKVKNFMK
ncbi:MAG: VWA domain-containing protein [Bacteroidaceae bacterium]|nr:VWA domain-containing protein [Bacteroidaceae bacterium]